MKFFDASKIWTCPDIFEVLSENDYSQLKLQDPDKRIRFRPVCTDRNGPADVAFIAMNISCGDEYAKAKTKFNYFEWAQDLPEFFKFLKPVMEVYCQAASIVYKRPAVAYVTTLSKLVLPKNSYGASKGLQVLATLKSSSANEKFCSDAILSEIDTLTSRGCKIFICFGAECFNETASILSSQTSVEQMTGIDQLIKFEFNGKSCLLVRSPHYLAKQDVVTEGEFISGLIMRHGLGITA